MAENIFSEFGIDLEDLVAADEVETLKTAEHDEERITPEDIEVKDFGVSLRGFDQVEVREYLHLMASAFRTTLQDAQLANLALESTKHDETELDDLVRHADSQIQDAKLMREEAARELQDAQLARQQAMRHHEEAEAALQMIKEKQAQIDAAPKGDPYELASVQIASVLRAADDAANETRRDAEDQADAIRLESEELLKNAKRLKEEVEQQTRRRAEQHLARVSAASKRVEQVMSTMEVLEGQMKMAIATAMDELKASTDLGDIIPLNEDKIDLAS